MCGLVAMVDLSNFGMKHGDNKIFFNMLLLNSIRGSDSTGTFGVNPRKNYADVLKAVGNPYDWNGWKAADEFMNRVFNRYNAIVGHGRSATIGEINSKNAHPFTHGDITLVHNGTLRNFHEIKRKNKEVENMQVDSESICWLVNQVGIEATVKEIQGAWALIWYDRKNQTLNFCRNSERPLYFSVTSDKRRMYIASEEHVVHSALYQSKDKYDVIYTVPTETWHSFSLTAKEIDITKTKLPDSWQDKWSGPYTNKAWRDDSHLYPTSFPPSNKQNTSPATKFVPSSTKPDAIVCLNEDVHFNLEDAEELETIEENGNKVIVLTGSHVDSAKIKVHGKYNKGLKALEDALASDKKLSMIGVVKSIVPIQDSLEKYSFRVFCDSVDFVPVNSGTNTLVPLHSPKIILKGNKKITLELWNKYQKDNCLLCDGELEYSKSHLCDFHMYKQGNKVISGVICHKCSSLNLEKVN